jgi:hypothetical protein
MKIFTYTMALLLTSCGSLWMGKGAALPTLVDKTQADIDGGNKGDDYIGAKTRKERNQLEVKLLRAQNLKGTKAGDFHWTALEMLVDTKDVPEWVTRLSVEAQVLTSEGLVSWETYQTSDKLPKEKKESTKKAGKEKKEQPSFEGVSAEIKLVRTKAGGLWRISGVAADINGPRFAAFAEKRPFNNGAALSAEEANDAAFDVSLLASAPPFDSKDLLRGFSEALATGDVSAFFLVAAPEGKPREDLDARLRLLSKASQELQVILGEAPSFIGLPAGVVELKVTMRGEEAQRLSFTIKRTKEGYRITSLKVKAKKDGIELDVKPLISDPDWTLKPNKK